MSLLSANKVLRRLRNQHGLHSTGVRGLKAGQSKSFRQDRNEIYCDNANCLPEVQATSM